MECNVCGQSIHIKCSKIMRINQKNYGDFHLCVPASHLSEKCILCKKTDTQLVISNTCGKILFYHQACLFFYMISSKKSTLNRFPPNVVKPLRIQIKFSCDLCTSLNPALLFKCKKSYCKFYAHVSCAIDNLLEFVIEVDDQNEKRYGFNCNLHRTYKSLATFKKIQSDNQFE